MAAMGCLFLLITLLSPRLGIIILWAFTNYVARAFDNNWLWPLLGLIFLPWTTLIYILVAAPVGSITFWGWLMVALGVLIDLSSHAQSWANRSAGAIYVQPRLSTCASRNVAENRKRRLRGHPRLPAAGGR